MNSDVLSSPPLRSRVRFVSSLLVAACATFFAAGCGKKAPPPSAPPPPEVTFQTITTERVALTNESPGRVNAIRIAQVRARIAGILLKRTFEEGSEVKAGQKLFDIDPAPFQAALQSARATVAKAEANAKQTQLLAQRYKGLIDVEAVSKQEYDNAQAAALQGEADIQSAKAALATAELNLGYATVTAPIDGRIGRALVTEGALVGQNETTPLATIQQLDPIYFDFTQSSLDLLRLRRAMDEGKVKVLAPGAAQVTLVLEDGSTYGQPGKLLFSDISVDPTTSMVTLRAEFPNPDRVLLPGMFGRARVEQAVNEEAITAPQRAVALAAGGTATAMVITEDNKVEARQLKLGAAFGDKWVVNEGLKAGDRIIIEGLQRVRPGVPVRPIPVGAAPAVTAAPGAPPAGGTPPATGAATNAPAASPAAAADKK